MLSKAFVASIAAPLTGVAIALAAQILLFAVAAIWLTAHGESGLALLGESRLLDVAMTSLHATLVLAVFLAPGFAWLRLVSSWARQATVLWALMIPPLLALIELVVMARVFDAESGYFGAGIARRIELGGRLIATLAGPLGMQLDAEPLRMPPPGELSTSLALAALLIAATIAMRRYRAPL